MPDEKPKFSIVDLLNSIGIEGTKVQFLDSALTGITTRKNNVSKITFETKEMTANDVVFKEKTGKTGIIVWVERDKLKKVLDAQR